MNQAGKFWARAARFLWALAPLCLVAHPLFAQDAVASGPTDTVGGIFCEVFKNAGGLTTFTSAIAYIVGGWLVTKGIFELIKRSSDPNTPLRNGLLNLISGAAVAALPHLVVWIHNTIYGDSKVPYYNFGCTANNGADPAKAVPLDEMLATFVNNINQPIIMLISAMCVILGAIMIFYNMVKLAKFGSDAQTNRLTPILGSLVIGAILMAFGHSMDVSLNTLFGNIGGYDGLTRYQTIAYAPGGSFSMERFDRAMNSVFIFLYIVGALSFTRGFFILKNHLEGTGQATKGQAFTHIISGTLLINMPGFIENLERTMGFDIIVPR